MEALSAENISLSIEGRRLLDDASLTLHPGEVHVLLGANGAGKSSLLRVMAGDCAPQAGNRRLNDRRLMDWTPRERARLRAVLPQGDALRFGFTVTEVVSLGRLAARTGTAEQEAALIAAALTDADAGALAERRYTSLSGGERQRVQLARVLVQLDTSENERLDGRYYLLDEPTAALDLAHQYSCLDAIRRRARRGAGVLAVLHDLNLALRIADRVSLLHQGRLLAQGLPRQALTATALRTAYGDRLDFRPREVGNSLQFEIEVRPDHGAEQRP